jgi:Zn-dependent protease
MNALFLPMLRFSLFGFQIIVHWMFWVVTLMLAPGNLIDVFHASTPAEVRALAAFMIAAFLSVLIHELGHASVMRRFGDRNVQVVLYSFGGYAQGSRRFSRWEDILVTAAGPGLQIAAGLAVYFAMGIWQSPSAWLGQLAGWFFLVSISWAVLNLLPILPLDGGRLCSAITGKPRLALRISLVTAVVLAAGFLYLGYGLFTPIFFGMLAYNNWQQLQQAR